MNNYFKTKTKLVQSVNDQLHSLEPSSVLTMTIIRDMYGDFSAYTVTGVLWDDTVEKPEQNSSEQPTNI